MCICWTTTCSQVSAASHSLSPLLHHPWILLRQNSYNWITAHCVKDILVRNFEKGGKEGKKKEKNKYQAHFLSPPLTHFSEGAQTSHVLDKRYPALHWDALSSSQVYITADSVRGCTSLPQLRMRKFRPQLCPTVRLRKTTADDSLCKKQGFSGWLTATRRGSFCTTVFVNGCSLPNRILIIW